jgi:hypothetical protein
MVDNIKLNKVVPALSSAPKVKRVDQRRGDEQQNPFEEVLKKRRRKKKKKDDSEQDNKTDGPNSTDNGQGAPAAASKDAEKGQKPADCESNRIIDIRV